MATSVAKALIEEYVAEVKERIDDDQKKIWMEQGFSWFGTARRILGLAIYSFSIFGFFFLVVLAGCLRESDIVGLMNASAGEIEAGIHVGINLFVTFLFITLLMSIAIHYRNYFRDLKQERLDREQAKLEEVRLIVTVCEEVLMRHKLISQEGVDNG